MALEMTRSALSLEDSPPLRRREKRLMEKKDVGKKDVGSWMLDVGLKPRKRRRAAPPPTNI